MSSSITEETYTQCADYIRSKLSKEFQQVKLGIICGSGLGGLVNTIDKSTQVEFKYQDLPGFAVSTVVGHAGKLVFGHLGKNRVPTVFMVGRFHFYEGFSLQQCTFPVRVMKLLGVEYLVVTNAAGGLQSNLKVADIIVLNDHITFAGISGNTPLRGPNVEAFGTRFPAISDAYTYELRELAFRAAFEVGIKPDDIREGIYSMVSGPSYETRTEARFLASLGADAVGMSTVPEVVVARHAGIKVLGLSLITNTVPVGFDKDAKVQVMYEMGLSDVAPKAEQNEESLPNHEEVLETSARRSNDLQQMVTRFADLLSTTYLNQ